MSKSDLQPGRELDALIAERVMGWQGVRICTDADLRQYYIPEDGIYPNDWIADGTVGGYIRQVPEYSTDIAAAWQIMEKLRFVISPYRRTFSGEQGWTVYRSDSDLDAGEPLTESTSAPHAICLAALKAIGHDNE